MKHLAIIGASYLQLPLIEKAKSLGITTHVFAWAADDVGEKAADFFYPISIVEKEAILAQCRKIGIDGITSIASDLAMITVGYVASAMGLCANSPEAVKRSTDKRAMRLAFASKGDPSPRSILVESETDPVMESLVFPVIVKPTDRSGSRGITKVTDPSFLRDAIRHALACGFEKKALVEEYAEGREYSVECISQNGSHTMLAVTEKFTTGAPHFIERGHIEPADLNEKTLSRIQKTVYHALDSLGITLGASHSELKIDESGTIRLIEIGGRMGGDFIGSDLVRISTGYDFVKAVIDCALGEKTAPFHPEKKQAAAVRFIFDEADREVLNLLEKEHPEYLVRADVQEGSGEVSDSSSRHGYFLMKAEKRQDLLAYLPEENQE